MVYFVLLNLLQCFNNRRPYKIRGKYYECEYSTYKYFWILGCRNNIACITGVNYFVSLRKIVGLARAPTISLRGKVALYSLNEEITIVQQPLQIFQRCGSEYLVSWFVLNVFLFLCSVGHAFEPSVLLHYVWFWKAKTWTLGFWSETKSSVKNATRFDKSQGMLYMFL